MCDLPEAPPVAGEDIAGAGAEDGEEDGGDGEQQEAADLTAAFELFGGWRHGAR